ncbi:stage II sporulation protein R [Anaerosacchariphilus polymeriproducens]|nr:stage II sporulation protein R [Anaerosacchariphilus polymeriproducens]
MKWKQYFKSILLGSAAIAAICLNNAKAQQIQHGIAEQVIRFHVIANSNSNEDQSLKIELKDYIAGYMKELLKDSSSIEQTRELIKENMSQIQKKAEGFIEKKGYTYKIQTKLGGCHFPEKVYGDCSFPAGDYEALEIIIGNGVGRNWWCVVYPSLCFVDGTYAVVSEETKEELKHVLTEEEYAVITNQTDKEIKIKYTFKTLTFFKEIMEERKEKTKEKS